MVIMNNNLVLDRRRIAAKENSNVYCIFISN